jgi:hypothetical protein
MTAPVLLALALAPCIGLAAFLAARILSRRADIFVPWKPEYGKSDLDYWNERTGRAGGGR